MVRKDVLFKTALMAFLLLAAASLYADADPFGGSIIREHANDLKSFLFGDVMFWILVVSGAGALGFSLFTNSHKRLVYFGILALSAGLIPRFIDHISRMLAR